MELTIFNRIFNGDFVDKRFNTDKQRNITDADVNEPFIIKAINTDDKAVKDFLFTLGCYEGETATVVSVLAENYVINVKGARYSIDADLAEIILI